MEKTRYGWIENGELKLAPENCKPVVPPERVARPALGGVEFVQDGWRENARCIFPKWKVRAPAKK